jgi:hypothetical protein
MIIKQTGVRGSALSVSGSTKSRPNHLKLEKIDYILNDFSVWNAYSSVIINRYLINIVLIEDDLVYESKNSFYFASTASF